MFKIYILVSLVGVIFIALAILRLTNLIECFLMRTYTRVVNNKLFREIANKTHWSLIFFMLSNLLGCYESLANGI